MIKNSTEAVHWEQHFFSHKFVFELELQKTRKKPFLQYKFLAAKNCENENLYIDSWKARNSLLSFCDGHFSSLLKFYRN